MQHCETCLWLSYKSYETKKKGVGKVEEKQAILHEEGKMDDCLDFSRSQEEESKTARVIRKCSSLFTQFIKYVKTTDTQVGIILVDLHTCKFYFDSFLPPWIISRLVTDFHFSSNFF